MPPVRKPLACQGCGEVLPRRQLVEVQHGDHNEHWFPGDLACGDCADRTGVAY